MNEYRAKALRNAQRGSSLSDSSLVERVIDQKMADQAVDASPQVVEGSAVTETLAPPPWVEHPEIDSLEQFRQAMNAMANDLTAGVNVQELQREWTTTVNRVNQLIGDNHISSLNIDQRTWAMMDRNESIGLVYRQTNCAFVWDAVETELTDIKMKNDEALIAHPPQNAMTEISYDEFERCLSEVKDGCNWELKMSYQCEYQKLYTSVALSDVKSALQSHWRFPINHRHTPYMGTGPPTTDGLKHLKKHMKHRDLQTLNLAVEMIKGCINKDVSDMAALKETNFTELDIAVCRVKSMKRWAQIPTLNDYMRDVGQGPEQTIAAKYFEMKRVNFAVGCHSTAMSRFRHNDLMGGIEGVTDMLGELVAAWKTQE